MVAGRAMPPITAPAMAAIRLEFEDEDEEATRVGIAVGNVFSKQEKSVPLSMPNGNENAGTSR